MNGQVGATGAVGREEGNGGRGEGREAGQLGERGLVEVKNSWTLWCWRTGQGSAVRHLGASRDTGQQGDRQEVRQTDTRTQGMPGFTSYRRRCYITCYYRLFQFHNTTLTTKVITDHQNGCSSQTCIHIFN